MGLDISLGGLAASIEEGDSELEEYERRCFQEVNRVLAANGLPLHTEPEVLPNLTARSEMGGMPYSWLHYLRRALAFARQAPHEFTPTTEGEQASEHPRIDAEYSIGTSHLICHSDTGGFYVPIDFPEPLYDNGDDSVISGMLGSSQQARMELIKVAPLLGIPLQNGTLSDQVCRELNQEEEGPLYIERKVWLLLFDVFTHSIEHKTAVCFH